MNSRLKWQQELFDLEAKIPQFHRLAFYQFYPELRPGSPENWDVLKQAKRWCLSN